MINICRPQTDRKCIWTKKYEMFCEWKVWFLFDWANVYVCSMYHHGIEMNLAATAAAAAMCQIRYACALGDCVYVRYECAASNNILQIAACHEMEI